jgi:hypothetical protein
MKRLFAPPDCARTRANRPANRRRGMALLMVLLLLSLTVGLSYAAMRSQTTVSMIQRNSDRRASARQDAITGLSMAMKKMNRSDWTGVGTSLNGSLGSNDTFLVTYTSGDAQLSATDPDQPYRVTLLSTGYSADPEQVQSIAIYRVRAVVRFIPRKLSAEPANWLNMLTYTVYQWTAGTFTMMPPSRIEGNVCIQSALDLTSGYQWSGEPRKHYYAGLEQMRAANLGDYKPFNATLAINLIAQNGETKDLLQKSLLLTTVDTPANTIADMPFPSTVSTYCLYPGGKQYSVPQLPATLQSVTYQADPVNNPAGLFFHTGPLTVYDDSTINGTLITAANSGGQITISGKRIKFNAVSLPALQGDTQPVQLPALIVGDTFRVTQNAGVTINGMVATSLSLQIDADSQADITMSHVGSLIARNVIFSKRTNWDLWSVWWDNEYNLYKAQKGILNGYKYFPQWLQKACGFNLSPQLTIKPSSTPIRYHWHNPQNPIYVPDPNDGGLRWDLLSWTENI